MATGRSRVSRVAIAAGLVAAVTAVPTLARGEYLGYPDISAGEWYVDGGVVDWAEENGVIHGFNDGTWGANVTIDRGQAATILWNNAGNPDPGEPATFTDSDDLRWAAEACAWAQDAGVFTGNPRPEGGSSMDPWTPLTREQAAKVLCMATGGEEADPSLLEGYSDAGEVSQWAEGVMAWAVSEGVITGRDTGAERLLAPQDRCTRAEFVAMLMRATGADEGEPGGGTVDPDPGNPGGGTVDPDPGNPGGGTVDPDPGDGGQEPAEDAYDIGNGTYALYEPNKIAGDGETSNVTYNGIKLYNFQPNFAWLEDAEGNQLKCGTDFTVEKKVDLESGTYVVTATGAGDYTGQLSITVHMVVGSSVYLSDLVCPACGRTTRLSDDYEGLYPAVYVCMDPEHGEAGSSDCASLNGKVLRDITLNNMGGNKDVVLVSEAVRRRTPCYCSNPFCENYDEDISKTARLVKGQPVNSGDPGYVVRHD